jgi:hypothetical protein
MRLGSLQHFPRVFRDPPGNQRLRIMGPAAREGNIVVAARASLVRLERIADDGAVVAGHQVFDGRGSFVVSDLVNDDARRGEAPHLPGLAVSGLESLPARLVETDDRLGKHTREQSVAGGFLEASSQYVQLVPKRLRCDVESVPPQDALLPRERDVIEVLVDVNLVPRFHETEG